MYLPLQTEALSLRLHGNGLGVHALVDRICRNLVAERVHRPFSIAQIVILVHFGVERIQAGQQLLIATWILVLEELHGTRHTRLDGRLLIGLADCNAQHRVRVFGQIQQVDQRGNIVEQRAENHATQAERVRGRLHRMQCQNRVVLRLRETIAAIERERVGRHFHALARGDPRHVLKQALSKAKEKGFTFYVHPEIEFYLFERQDDWSQTPTPIDEGGYFDHVPRSPGMDFRRATVNMLEQMGISVEYSHHEAGPGQNEIDLRYADALTTADNIMTFRTVVKEISLERGIHASFMPKPLSDAPGSGMHTHLSLFEGDANAFYEAGQEFNMSVTARQFAAGILYHAAEICAVTDQYVNSYKRLWGGNEAPSYICWGHNNRSALLRIPQYKPGKGNSARMEFRALDPVANPYLAYSVLLAAGLDGIDKQMRLGEPTSDDVWELTDAERQAMGIQPLPESLDEALKVMEKSDFVAGVLGEHAFEYFLRNKRQEWEEYRKQVTPFELKKYLPKL